MSVKNYYNYKYKSHFLMHFSKRAINILQVNTVNNTGLSSKNFKMTEKNKS